MTSTEDFRRTNLELVRRAVDAFQRGDLEGVLAEAREDFEIFLPSNLPNSGRFVGLDGYSTWLGQWLDAWEDFTVEIVEMQPVGDRHVIATVRQSGLGKGSGIPVEMEIAYMWDVRDGRLAALHLYPSREEAVQVAERRERAE
ncbi:MAG TPA: nuclear transport factor 2 family protein [Solirubrobacterales bacterium]|nr:nuclear transport factor 2 family protein [Solirubrobacterales bacterium]